MYDPKGNQIDDGEKFVMVYDPNNRLKEVRDRTTQEVVVTCKYDVVFDSWQVRGRLAGCVQNRVQNPVFGQ